ncbi:MAG: glycine/sarcosine/betaine reductase component B subunit, partial [Pseudonocardiaceae bacterium]
MQGWLDVLDTTGTDKAALAAFLCGTRIHRRDHRIRPLADLTEPPTRGYDAGWSRRGEIAVPALDTSTMRRIVHEVRSVEIGVATRYEQHRLVVGRDQAEALFADPALASVRVHTAVPGDRVRIIAPLDVVEPRTKGSGSGAFPGWAAPVNRKRGGDT